MRRKIKELMNKEEGFTLVELLAVIVILGIIVAIAIPAVGSVIDRANSGATKSEQALVEDAARLYVTTRDGSNEDLDWSTATEGSQTASLAVDKLYDGGFLEDRDGERLGGNVKVTRTKVNTEGDSNIYTYEYDAEDVGKADEKTVEDPS